MARSGSSRSRLHKLQPRGDKHVLRLWRMPRRRSLCNEGSRLTGYAWLAPRSNSMGLGPMYEQIAKNRDDAAELIECVERTVSQLLREETSTQRPGILLGKIQSGKTRAFLGVIASAF